MIQKFVLQLFKDIKSLKIQGASNVRKGIVNGLSLSAEKSKAKNLKEFQKELKDTAELLLSARPTEPEARNACNIILRRLDKAKNLDEARELIINECKEFELNRKKVLNLISKNGGTVIKPQSTVFTHCHSHTVEEIFIKNKNKIKKVIATETRPLYQGHLTVKALTSNGLQCKLIVDSAASTFMEGADAIFVGSDAITTKEVINKIGTRTMSFLAKEFNKPFYVCSSSLKFDPRTVFGYEEVIEQRPVKEVWNIKLNKLEIENPAFDRTPLKNVKGIITELGVWTPEKFVDFMKKSAKKNRI